MSSEIHTRRHKTEEIPKANHGVTPRSRVVRCTYLMPLSSIHGGALTRPQDRQEEEEAAGGRRERESLEKAAMTVVPARMGLRESSQRWDSSRPKVVLFWGWYFNATISICVGVLSIAACSLVPSEWIAVCDSTTLRQTVHRRRDQSVA